MSVATAPRPVAFGWQYSFRDLLRVMTGTQVCVALVCWDRGGGTLLSILLVGGWWLVVALRARWYRAAYCLAAWVMGAVLYVALSLPLSPASHHFLVRCHVWPDFLRVVAMCVAAAVAGTALERWIRRPWSARSVVVGMCFAVLTLAVYPVAWALALVLFHGVLPSLGAYPSFLDVRSEPTLVGECVEAILAAPRAVAVAGSSLHVAALVGTGAVYLLGWIAALGSDLPREEGKTLDVVRQLQREGRDPIRGYHVAQRLGCDVATVLGQLKDLWALHRITWTPRHGYRGTR